MRVVVPQLVLTPYVGVGPLRFGMTRADVEDAQGAPDVDVYPRGSSFLAYPHVHVVLHDEHVAELQYVPGSCVVRIDDHDVLTVGPQGPLLDQRRLIVLDGAPRELGGVLYFYRLGVLAVGFHNHEWDRRGLVAFEQGAHDEARDAPAWDWNWK